MRRHDQNERLAAAARADHRQVFESHEAAVGREGPQVTGDGLEHGGAAASASDREVAACRYGQSSLGERPGREEDDAARGQCRQRPLTVSFAVAQERPSLPSLP
jgi:hypothetical protein